MNAEDFLKALTPNQKYEFDMYMKYTSENASGHLPKDQEAEVITAITLEEKIHLIVTVKLKWAGPGIKLSVQEIKKVSNKELQKFIDKEAAGSTRSPGYKKI